MMITLILQSMILVSATESISIMNATLPAPSSALSCAEDSSTNSIYCLGGITDAGKLDQITKYVPMTDVLTIMNATLPTNMSRLGCVTSGLNNKIYCFGGQGSENNITEYNPLTDQSSNINNFSEGGFGISCAEDSSTHDIYCFGGQLDSIFSPTIRKYDPENNIIVNQMVTLPSGRSGAPCAENSATNKIYCFGGDILGTQMLDEIIEYNPAEDSILLKSAVLPVGRQYLSCEENSLTHKIYCFGGRNNGGSSSSNEIMEYDSQNDSLIVSNVVLPSPRDSLSCAEDSSTHDIYCFGGDNSGTKTDQIVKYTNKNITLTNIIPIQVIENVDLVKDKSTLVRVNVANAKDDSEQITVALFFNNTNIENKTQTVPSNNSTNFDFWHIPSVTGTNLDYRAEMSSANSSSTDEQSKFVDVVWTRDLTLAFVAVDGPTEFQSTALDSIDYLYKTYPLKDGGVNYRINKTNLQSQENEYNLFNLYLLLYKIHKSTLIAGELPERSVGIVPDGWFFEKLNYEDTGGISLSTLYPWAVLVEEDFSDNDFYNHITAHELGHTYGLCDEYNETTWDIQNRGSFGFSSDICPNGDSNDDEILDSNCPREGCPTSTLEPLNGLPDEFQVHNLMGSTVTLNTWVSRESYNHLLGEFNHSTPIPASERAVVSGLVNVTSGEVNFDNFYTLEYGLAENEEDHTSGNYSLQILDNNSNLLYNISFDVSTLNVFFNGSTIENNATAFAFTVPLNFSTTAESIVVKHNGITKDTRNITGNTPSIDLISPSGERTYSNQEITINWIALDLDGDELNYAVLFSSDNGSTYNTIAFDLNETNISINSNNLEDSDQYLIKVLATDGVNTGESIMNSTFEIDNDLKINEFKVVYQNNTERAFIINLNNTFTNTTINNITWEFNSGEDAKNSVYNITLQPSENILYFIYHNYPMSGSYNASFKARSGDYIETEMLEIEI